MNKLWSILGLLWLVSLPCLAQETLDNHFFMNFSGYKILDKTFDPKFSEGGAAGTFGYGRVLSDYVTVEVSVSSFSEVKDKVAGLERTARGVALSSQLLGTLPVWRTWRMLAKIGLSHWKFKYGSDLEPTEIRDGVNLIYGIGVAFDADHDSTIRFEYEGYNDKPGLTAFSFGIQHNF